jgi:hypothetical protein
MLPCPTCGASIQPPNEELTIGACARCGGVFEWPLVSDPAPVLDQPRAIVVERRDGKVHAIRRRGSIPGAVFAVLIPVALALVAANSLWMAFYLLFLAGILFWESLGRALGIRILLGRVIAIRNGLEPVRRFVATAITQPFVRRVERSSLSDRYALCAIQSDGTVVTLAGGFSSAVEARYMELELEAALGIEDAPVPGEAKGDAYWVDEGAPLQPLRLACPACGTALNGSDLQLRKGQAVCPGCRNGFMIGGPAAAGTRVLVRLPPPRVVVDRTPEAFALEAPFRAAAEARPRVRGSASTIARDVALLCFGAVVIGGTLMHDRSFLLWMGAAMMLFMAMSLWRKLVSELRVHIRGENGTLHVHVGPTWLRPPRVISVAEITQVFMRGQPHSWIIHHRGYLQLCILDREGRVKPIVGWLRDLGEARSLEEQLEQVLGIEDAPVSGEIVEETPRQLAGAPALPESGNLSLPDASVGGELSVPVAAGALSDPE